jgi:hypothetical protein
MSEIEPKMSDIKQSEHAKFVPNERMRFTKAKFWAKIKENPSLKAEGLDIASICEISNSLQIRQWLQKPAFNAWFWDKDVVRHKIQANAEYALETLADVMGMEGEKVAGARVKAAEITLRLAGWEPAKIKVTEFMDEDISKMDEVQVREFLNGVMKVLKSGE